MLGSINKNSYVILALLMSMTMMIVMAGPATAAGCSNPAHQHFISFNSTETMQPVAVAATKRMSIGPGSGDVLVADKVADNISSYNKSATHHTIADSGSVYLYKQSQSVSTHHSNRHALTVAFKHRSPPDGWHDVKRQ